MSDYKWCHGPKCHKSHTQDRIRGTQGQIRTSKDGSPCLTYWDLDADGWRMATGNMRIKI